MNRQEKRLLKANKSLVCTLYNIVDKYLTKFFVIFENLSDTRPQGKVTLPMKTHYLFVQFAHTIRQLLDLGSIVVISFQNKTKEISLHFLNELISSTANLIENKNFQLRLDKLII